MAENNNASGARTGMGGRPGRGPGRGGPVAGMMPGEKAKNFRRTMGRLIKKYISPFKVAIIFVAIFAVLSTVFSTVSPAILGKATNVIVEGIKSGMSGGTYGVDFDALLKIILLLVALYVVSALFQFGMSYIMAGVSQKITYRMRKEMSEKMDRLPLSYFDKMTHGEVLSRVTNDIDTVSQSLTMSLTSMITSVVTLVGVLAMMLYISPILTLAALVVIPLSVLIMKTVVSKSQQQFKNNQKFLGELNGHIEEMYTGHLIVKAYNGEDDAIEEFEEVNDRLAEAARKSQFYSGFMMPLTSFVGNLAYVFVCVMGGYLALKSVILIGDIQAFVMYVRSFNQPLQQVANIANTLQSTAAAAERVFEFLDEPEETEKEGELRKFDRETFRGEITFDHVSFGYDPDNILIHDFCFTAKPGQRIAIAGPTGAGKTTMVKLLMRFYDVTEGRILIDGVDIREYSRHDLREMFGMVLQDTWLFTGTIMENIRYGRMDATNDEVRRAAKAAHVHHFVASRPKGYFMVIKEDASNVSQGQKQLLTIARAFLADAPILILDEATSSVDTRTEVMIQKATAALMKNRTSFIIAHRLSTIRDADVIIVMKDGGIVETGSHDELMAAGGFYSEMYNSQFA